jgi:hypothetical protein
MGVTEVGFLYEITRGKRVLSMLRFARRCLAAGTVAALVLSVAATVGDSEASAAQQHGPLSGAQSRCSTTTVHGVAHKRCITLSMTSHRSVKNSQRVATARANARGVASGAQKPKSDTLASIPPGCDGGSFNPDRFLSCSEEGWNITETEEVDGVPTITGTVPILITSSAQFSIDTGTASWILSAEIDVGGANGTLAHGVEGTMGTACGNHPEVCETTKGDEFQPIALTSFSTHTAEWEQIDNGPAVDTNNSVDLLDGYLGVVLELEGGLSNPVELDDAEFNSLHGRCDSVNPGLDCVDQAADIAVAFDATFVPLVGPVADHVFKAEASLPSHWGNPNYSNSAISRTTNQKIIDRNRNTACTGVAPACDEYPMASTYQGASRSAPGDWSAVTVPDSANDSQGGVMSVFYQHDRVLDGDFYYVLAVRADGSQSW